MAYELLEDITDALTGKLEPERKEISLGEAKILQIFEMSNGQKVCGCLVESGTVKVGAKARVYRRSHLIYNGEVSSLRRFQDDVKEDPCGQSAEDIHQIVRLNIDRRCTEQDVERQGEEEKASAVRPQQQHQHRAHPDVGGREGCGGAFARSLCAFNESAEETFGTGRRCQIRVCAEIVPQRREHSLFDAVKADGLEVVLRTGDGQEEIDEIVEEEGPQHDEGGAFKRFAVHRPRFEDGEEDERIVGEIAKVEEFAPQF